MTTKQYIKSIEGFNFKKYEVDVKVEGNCANSLVFKVYLNNELAYETKKGDFVYETYTSGGLKRTKFFVKFFQYEAVRINWKNNKPFMKFTSWSKNFRINKDIMIKFQQAKDEFEKTLYQVL